MSMTHYMELLMLNAPWNLLIFMALPVVLAETIAITSLLFLTEKQPHPIVGQLNRISGILAGIVFLVIDAYLIVNAVIPLHRDNGWRGWIDLLAVYCFIAAGIPMIGIALLRLNILHRAADSFRKTRIHALYVIAFLVLSHLSMIAGMADPTLGGYIPSETPAGHHAEMHHHPTGTEGTQRYEQPIIRKTDSPPDDRKRKYPKESHAGHHHLNH